VSDYMTFYGATDLEARRRALRFQAENLDYVLMAVCFISCQSGLAREHGITVQIEPYRAGPGSTVSGTRIILLDRAAAMLKLPKEEAMAMAYAGGEDASAAEQRVRLEAVQKERHRSVAAMKGATCRATGWPKTAPHGYTGANADAWLHAWKYCDAAMRHEAAPPDMADLKAPEIWEWAAAAMNGAAARAVNWSRDAYAGDSADAWRRGWDHCDEALRRHAESEYKDPARPRVAAVTLDVRPACSTAGVTWADCMDDWTVTGNTLDVLRKTAARVGWKCYRHSRGIGVDGEWIDVTELGAAEGSDAGDI
jgi:hypothetical protein